LLRLGFHAVGVALVSLYGAFGLDGLAHYTLALCSEHTLATNVTIWSEAVAGFTLMLAAVLLLGRRLARRPGVSGAA
jgi:nitrate reductase gamma subunit